MIEGAGQKDRGSVDRNAWLRFQMIQRVRINIEKLATRNPLFSKSQSENMSDCCWRRKVDNSSGSYCKCFARITSTDNFEDIL